jgi:hypothetical protein
MVVSHILAVPRPPWEGPTARHYEKGGRLMSRSSLLPTRPELCNFFTHCERILVSAKAPGYAPFSEDEQRQICYYANQLAKLTDGQSIRINEKRGRGN